MATGSTIWLAGDCEHPDFLAPVDWLRCNCHCVSRETSPISIVVFQSRPGSVSRYDVESLHLLAPLAQLILLTGLWCDGERLSRKAATGVTRIGWHQWRERLPQALGVLGRIPRTASDSDRLEQAFCGPVAGISNGGSILICAETRASYESLADACRTLGLSSSWQAETTAEPKCAPTDLVLIDGWPKDQSARPMALASAAHRILLLDFPRPEDQRRAAEWGFTAVVARPLLLTDLVAVLKRSGAVPSAAPARVA